ncbi:hypothetical protein BGW80DRAFT_1457517 [Lactifluus volemus]|nr:hypothetical protein BGW80DRAFT_1457517 [Lactifluus volemus]
MSVARRSDRRAARNQLQSPYSRPNPQPKKSSWSLSGLFGFLNPLRRKESSEEPVENSSEEGAACDERQSADGSESGISRAADFLSQRVNAAAAASLSVHAHTTTPGHRVACVGLESYSRASWSNNPFKASTTFESPRLDAPSQSPVEKLEAVKQYLRDRADQPLHHVEYVGLVSLLKDSVQDDDAQPFRFSTSPTPSRDTTPAFNVGSPTSSQQTPRRTLTRNPNGVYKWQGAGSARPRNRHQSPAFGPPRPTPSKFKLSSPEQSPNKSDIKRRRIDTATESPAPHGTHESSPSTPPREQPHRSSALSTSSGSSSSCTTMNDASPTKSGAVSSTPLLRLSMPPKPTTPAVPSPLRNTWGTGDSSSPPRSSPPSKLSQPTRAANFMAELIKEPSQTFFTKEARQEAESPEGRPKGPEKKEANLSPQTIIEATVPTGSKRSRPPPNIGKASTVKVNGISHPEPPRRSTRLKSPSPPRTNGIHTTGKEQGDDEPEGGDTKRQRKAPRPTVEEVPDMDMHSPTSPTSPPGTKTPTSNGNSFGAAIKSSFPGKSSAPKEPSKLRFGFAAESDPESPPPTKSVFDDPTPERSVPMTRLHYLGSSTEPHSTQSSPKDPKQAALSLDSTLLPSFSFNVPQPSSSQVPLNHAKERDAASVTDSYTLPTFAFTVEPPKPAPLPAPSAPIGFNWEAAGMKRPVKVAGTWTCSTCMLTNDNAKVQCVACETPRPPDSTTSAESTVTEAAASEPPKAGLDWTQGGTDARTRNMDSQSRHGEQ